MIMRIPQHKIEYFDLILFQIDTFPLQSFLILIFVMTQSRLLRQQQTLIVFLLGLHFEKQLVTTNCDTAVSNYYEFTNWNKWRQQSIKTASQDLTSEGKYIYF